MLTVRILATVAIAAIAAIAPAAAASAANTLPNPYTPVGVSWVNVPAGDRVYLENFGDTDFDDDEIFYVAAGIECTSGAVTATGPFLTAGDNLDASDCIDAALAPVDPINTPARLGSSPFGFPINFFGATYSSAWPNTNGGIYFDSPDDEYDETLAYLANSSQSSGMFPLGGDLEYTSTDSNFWTAQTTVDGAPAVVFTWEDFNTCCSNTGDISFQIVLINAGGGNFNAWFNYDSFSGFNNGYDASTALINLRTGVTPGSNVLVAQRVDGVPSVCTEGDFDEFGTPTDAAFVSALSSGGPYFKVDNAAARTISVWADSLCTLPVNVNVVQNEAADLAAYLQLEDDDVTEYEAVAVGWSTYNSLTAEIDATELLFNVNVDDLANGATNPLIQRSLNTTVPGRFIIGQRGGATVTDPAALGLGTAAGPTLPAAGLSDLSGGAILAGALLLAGLGIVFTRRRSAV